MVNKMANLTEMSYAEIKTMATSLGIEKVNGVKKVDLIAQIEAAQSAEPVEKTPAQAYASKIYNTVAAQHPDWDRKRVYATVGSILKNNNKKRAEAEAPVEA